MRHYNVSLADTASKLASCSARPGSYTLTAARFDRAATLQGKLVTTMALSMLLW